MAAVNLKRLCQEFHLTPDQVRSIDAQEIRDFTTILNYETQISQDEQARAQREAEQNARGRGIGG